jgi:branched-chain amino acid transport system substrate-binding protein
VTPETTMTYPKQALRRAALLLSSICLLPLASAQTATSGISDGVVKIGVLTDMSGVYSDVGGAGSVIAAQMAAEDFGSKVLGAPIEVVVADHQNKTDIASSRAREWYESQKVDMITDMNNSAVGLAVVNIARKDNKIAINNGAGTIALTNDNCAPTSIHYTYDTYALAHGTARSVVAHGGDTWYFLTADYAFGKALEDDVSSVVKSSGGKVLGSVRHPLNANDFSSFLMSAQSSKAKIIGLANAGRDTINAIKTAREFKITEKQKLAGLLVFIQDIHSIGLDTAQGIYVTTAFYWDRDEASRAWSKRFFQRAGKMPSMIHAGVYSSTRHYLKAIQAAGTDNADAVMAKMKATPVDDFFSRGGIIRPDGRMIHDMYLVQVKTPQESKYAWDYYKVIATIPKEEAFKPLAQSTCPLVNKAATK